MKELDFEEHIISLLKKQHFEYFSEEEFRNLRINRYDNSPDISQVCVWKDFEKSFKKINADKKIDKEIVNKVINIIEELNQSSNLFKRNLTAHKYFLEGISIENNQGEFTNYKIIDFENFSNNIFVVTNQLTVVNGNENRRPDIVIYLNGFPIIIWELKNPKNLDIFSLNDSESNLEGAYNQILNYSNQIPNLFTFNFFNVISDETTTKFGSIFSSLDHFHYWKSMENKQYEPSNFFIEHLFNQETLIDLLKNFTFFIESNESKIIASYHQYYGVRSALKNINKAISDKTKKGGIFFHTTGSGKSYSMIFLARNFTNEHKKSTIIIVSDRSDLDNQTYNNFLIAENFLFQTPKQVKNIQDLVQKLDSIKQDGIYFSTIQKFQDSKMKKSNSFLSERSNILIITDEAHRSHNNLYEEQKPIIDEKSKEIKNITKISPALTLRNCFPNATFIGFTATPIENNDISTKEIYGPIVTTYTMNQATNDGVVVKLNYERKHTFFITPSDAKTQDEINAKYDEITSKMIEEGQGLEGNIARKKLNKELNKIENLISDPKRMDKIVEDFGKLYNAKKNNLKGKALFICFNRKIAFYFYKNLIQQFKSFDEITKLILTPSQQDLPDMKKSICSDPISAAKEFKDPDSNFKIAIVVDMWLTGFDVPSLDLICIDKPIKLHNLIQTISRVNRVYVDKSKNLVKTSGLIVDYFGITDHLKRAYEMYNKDKAIESTSLKKIIPEDIEKIKSIKVKEIDEIYKRFFYNLNLSFDNSNTCFVSYQLMLDDLCKNTKIKERDNFLIIVKELKKDSKSIMHILDEFNKNRTMCLICVHNSIMNLIVRNIKANFADYIDSFKKLLCDSMQYSYSSTIDKDNLGNPIDIRKLFEESMKDKVKEDELMPNTKAMYKYNLYLKVANEYQKIDVIRSKSFIDRMEELLSRYNEGFISFKEFINRLQQVGEDILNNFKNDDQLKMPFEELAFYKIISSDSGETNNKKDKEIALKIAKEVYEKFLNTQSFTNNWYRNEKLILELKRNIKEIMKKYNFPPEDRDIGAEKYVNKIINKALERGVS